MMSALQVPNPDVGQSSSSIDHKDNNNNKSSQDARFSCNICFDAVTEPVVTRCGHLYCWPCLYRWLAPGMTPRERASLGMRPQREPLTEGRRVCPVCKSECSVPTVVPIYVRNEDTPRPTQQQHPVPEPERHQPDPHPTQQAPPSPPVPVPVADAMSEDGNMGLDIDDDDDIDVAVEGALEHHNIGGDPMIPRTITMSTPEPSPSGLRQRRPQQEDDDITSTAIVPTRPMPVRDRDSTRDSGILQRSPSPTSRNNTSVSGNNGPTPNHHARATLSYGLVLALYQIFLNATNSSDTDNADANHGNGNSTDAEAVPSLHYPQQRRDSNNLSTSNEDLDADPAATIFLSRLLLGLSLFVLICLLSF